MSNESNLGNLNILVVDDYPDTAKMLALMLQLEGYNTAAACNSIEVADMLANFKPDVLILDVAMPDMDGYELAAHICNYLGNKPLLIGVSGYDKLEARSRREGFDHHFLKPFKAEMILEALARFAQRKFVSGAREVQRSTVDGTQVALVS